MTPQDASRLVDCPNPNRIGEIHKFILTASARDLQLFIHNIQTNTTDTKGWRERAEVALDIHLAEDAEQTAQKLVTGTNALVELSAKLTNQTDRLIKETFNLTELTRGLNKLTFILGVFAVIQIFVMVFEYCSKTH